MRGHYTITHPGSEISTSTTCAKTLNREGSTFQLCLSSSRTKTKIPKTTSGTQGEFGISELLSA
uniref:Uncharacterized protein n=1 Tax=Catharus ustulatus TaxID=91951 RepID=A0A8C3V5X1_CATUS